MLRIPNINPLPLSFMRCSLLLLISVTFLIAAGLLMIFSATSADVLDHDPTKSTHAALLRQMLYVLAGGFLAFGVWKIGYQKLLSYSPFLLAFLTFLLVLVLIPGVGREVNGSKRWLSIAGFSFQPSEFTKYVIVLFFIQRFLSVESKVLTFRNFLRLAAILSVPIILVLVEPNNGTAAVMAVTLMVLFILVRIPLRYWAFPLLGAMMIGGIFASNLPYVKARVNVYLHPELDLRGKGHQPHQAKIAAGSGQLFGRGPGNSLQKLSYLPEAQNDYIAAIYAEEYGFVGMATLISIYMLIGTLGFYIALSAPDRQGFYLAGAVTFLICFQAFLNLGVVSGLLPSTGLNLPFFSQGGTSLMANIMGIGLLLSISLKNELLMLKTSGKNG